MFNRNTIVGYPATSTITSSYPLSSTFSTTPISGGVAGFGTGFGNTGYGTTLAAPKRFGFLRNRLFRRGNRTFLFC
jgi:hypothetical protein